MIIGHRPYLQSLSIREARETRIDPVNNNCQSPHW